MTTAARPKRLPSPVLWATIAVIGLVVGIASGVLFARPFIHLFRDSPRITGSQPAVVHLGKGHYAIYDHDVFAGQVSASEVTVTAPDGRDVPTVDASVDETITKNGETYQSAVRFDTEQAGDFRITFLQDQPVDVLVGRTFTDTFHQGVPWLPTTALGGLTFIGGLTMFIISLVRRSRATRAAPVAYTTPVAGWYPDTERPGNLRYWDGTAWTEHRN